MSKRFLARLLLMALWSVLAPLWLTAQDNTKPTPTPLPAAAPVQPLGPPPIVPKPASPAPLAKLIKTKGKVDKSAKIELNLSEVDLKSFINLISKATGTTFLFEDTIAQSKKVTLLSTHPFTVREAYRIFENILDLNGYTTVNEGPYIRIISKNDAKSYQTNVSTSTVGEITQGDYVTMVLEVRNTDVNNMRGAITPFLNPNTLLNIYPATNLLIIRDTRDIVRKIVSLVKVLDQKNFNLQVLRVPIQYGDINQVVKVLTDLMLTRTGLKNLYLSTDAAGRTLLAIGPRYSLDLVENYAKILDVPLEQKDFEFFSPHYSQTSDLIKMGRALIPAAQANTVNRLDLIEDTRANRILMIGVKPEIKRMREFLAQVDIPLTGQAPTYRVFHLSNSNADDLAKTLQLVTKSVTIVAQTLDTKTTSTPANPPGSAPIAPPLNPPAPTDRTPGVAERTVLASAQGASSLVIVPDIPTNSLVVFANPAEMYLIDNLIKELDTVRPQIYLEMMILEVALQKSLNMGINWKMGGVANGNLVGVAGGGATIIPSSLTTLPTEAASSSIGVLGPALTYQGQTFSSYSAFIQATAGDTDFNVVSNPQVLTLVNQEATIRVGDVQPFQTATRIDTNNNVINSYDYKEIGVTLKFTAQVSGDDSIKLKIDQTTKNVKNTTTAQQTTNFTPTTTERQITTNIITKNNEIVVLGGLISENSNRTLNKTACLGDIPLLGWLFKNKSENGNKTNLLVYIRPHLIRTVGDRASLKASAENYFQQHQDAPALDIVQQKVQFGQKPTSRETIGKLQNLPTVLSNQNINPELKSDSSNDLRPSPFVPVEPIPNPADTTH